MGFIHVRYLMFLTCLQSAAAGEFKIVAAVDQTKLEEDPQPNPVAKILQGNPTDGKWRRDISIIPTSDNNSIETLEAVCDKLTTGGIGLLDMTAPSVGPLIRSFARTMGLAYMTLVDQSTLLPVDFHPDLHLSIEPPGSSMFQIIPDIVRYENFTKVAILYDSSFDLNVIPKRILTGVPAQHLYQRIASTEQEINKQLSKLKQLEIKIFFIISSPEVVDKLLGEAGRQSMFSEKYNWFVLTKGPKVDCYSCRNKSTVIHISGHPNYARQTEYLTIIDKFPYRIHRNVAMWVDKAFLYDLMIMMDKTIGQIAPNVSATVQDCYTVTNSSQVYVQSKAIVDKFRQMTRQGVYGDIKYSQGTLRQEIVLTLKKITFEKGAIEKAETIGNWTEEQNLIVPKGSLIDSQTKKHYRVVVVPRYPPFIYRHSNGSVHTYTGYCIDLLKKIAEDEDFSYELYEPADQVVGAMADDGTWNGVINELIQKRADIAVGPISVMAERENVVDFTVPYYDLVGLTILMKKPKFDYFLFKFLFVLDGEVWGCIIAAFFLFSGLLCIFDRLSPFSYQNNRKLWNGQGAEPRLFTLKEGVWFCMMSLTPQGGGEAPRALSGRLIAATWWLFGFIIIATYTANLAAFLTVSRLETPIKSLDDLSNQYKVKYGPNNGSSALVYFKRMAEIEERFYSIWKQMSLNDSLDAVERAKLAVWDYPVSNKYTKLWETMQSSGFPNTLDEAIDRVLTGEFAYIGDAAENQYQTLTNCELWEVGEEFSRKPFAFAVQDGSELRSQLSNAILKLLNERHLEKLKSDWWDMNDKKVECAKREDESDGISIKNIGGVFLVIATGTGLALICLVLEFYLYRYKPKQGAKRYGVAKTQSKAQLATNVSSTTLGSGFSYGETSIWPDVTLDVIPHTNGHTNVAMDTKDEIQLDSVDKRESTLPRL